VDTYELAVVKNDGKKEKWPLCYDSGITEDVEGGISASEVTEFMERVQKMASIFLINKCGNLFYFSDQ